MGNLKNYGKLKKLLRRYEQMENITKTRINELRKRMSEKSLDAYIISSCDGHQSEYVAEYWRSLRFISGFTGSAGTVLITPTVAYLWTDGRYFIQAEKQFKGSGFELMKLNTPGYPTLAEWIGENLEDESRIGFDGRTISVNVFNEISSAIGDKEIEFSAKNDLINSLWPDRPQLPSSQVYLHQNEYTGKTFAEKLSEVREIMKKKNVSKYFISSLDDIAWLFNLRGSDVDTAPFFLSYALIGEKKVTLYLDENRLTDDAKEQLLKDNVKIHPYNDVNDELSEISGKTFYLDSNRTNYTHNKIISKRNKATYGIDFTTDLKAVKNETEISNIKKAYIRDGAAVTKFIIWLKNNVGKFYMDEITVSEKLLEFRQKSPLLKGVSFNTIAAYKDNAALMHYSATAENKAEVKAEGFLLVDSGGQYLDGTTDITRTMTLGTLTDEEKTDFTLVLKAMMGVARPKFIEGTIGGALDILARTHLWDLGLDYKCGTGHGIGYFLNVHEGPHSFRIAFKTPLVPGMLITNEPGIYKENRHGIRIENTQLVVDDMETEFGKFYSFETISYVPIDLDALKVEMLTDIEKNWLNDYHAKCYTINLPYMETDEEREALKMYTAAV